MLWSYKLKIHSNTHYALKYSFCVAGIFHVPAGRRDSKGAGQVQIISFIFYHCASSFFNERMFQCAEKEEERLMII